jgi:hypothetical protein
VLATDVLVEGFVFTGANAMTAIDCRWTGATEFGDGLTVRHCAFDDVVTTAIRLEFSYYCEVHDCRFESCGTYGIYADPAMSAVEFAWIHDNWFNQIGTTALYLGEAVESEVYNNRFYNATAVAAGAATNCMITTAAGARNFVHHNTMSCLLPVPANGDYNDCNSSSGTDAWVENYCIDGPTVARPT